MIIEILNENFFSSSLDTRFLRSILPIYAIEDLLFNYGYYNWSMSNHNDDWLSDLAIIYWLSISFFIHWQIISYSFLGRALSPISILVIIVKITLCVLIVELSIAGVVLVQYLNSSVFFPLIDSVLVVPISGAVSFLISLLIGGIVTAIFIGLAGALLTCIDIKSKINKNI